LENFPAAHAEIQPKTFISQKFETEAIGKYTPEEREQKNEIKKCDDNKK